MDVVPAAAELEEGSFCLQDRGEDVFVAEVGQKVRVSLSAVLAYYAFLDSPLLLCAIGLQHLFLLLFHFVQFLFFLVVFESLLSFRLLSGLEEFLEVALHEWRIDLLVKLMSEVE